MQKNSVKRRRRPHRQLQGQGRWQQSFVISVLRELNANSLTRTCNILSHYPTSFVRRTWTQFFFCFFPISFGPLFHFIFPTAIYVRLFEVYIRMRVFGFSCIFFFLFSPSTVGVFCSGAILIPNWLAAFLCPNFANNSFSVSAPLS